MSAWTLGVELEFLAAPGSDRRAVAERLAQAHDATLSCVFHQDTEPSLVPGTPVFDNLSVGFEIHRNGRWLARCVDDLTLQTDLDRHAPPRPGWWRVVSDDRRLLNLAARHGRADGGLDGVLTPLAELFGTTVDLNPGGIHRVVDRDGAPVALGAGLPGERERGCELVTAPIEGDLTEGLERLLAPVRDMGLTLATESATHVHVDGRAFEDARVFANLVELWLAEGERLKEQVGTNPHCRRLGGWPPALLDTVRAPGFRSLSWPQARARLMQVGLTKYCDLNLKNIVQRIAGKHTVEIRVLPGLLEPREIADAVAPFVALLRRATR